MQPHLIFEVSQIGNAVKKCKWKTGLFRYAMEILDALRKQGNLHLSFAQTTSPRTIALAKKHLRKNGYHQPFCNRRASILPFNLGGRGERYFNWIYNKAGINIDRICYDNQHISSAHLFHSPYPPIPERLKSISGLKRIITIHDLIPILDKYYDLAGKEKMQETIDSIGHDHVICVSANTRYDLLNHCPGLDPDKVFVSHLAADPQKFYPCRNTREASRIRLKYGLPETYFLSLCTLEPRKNLDHIIRCFLKYVHQEKEPDIHLVLAGAVGWKTERIFSALEEAGDLRNRIVLTGRIADEDMAGLYSNALAFFFVSLYEGFGLPPLEAMQCGVPVVVSNVSSLPEIAGDAGWLVSPEDDDALCQSMHVLYSNSDLHLSMQEASLKQASRFSWETTARTHLEIYHQIINQ